MYSNKPSVNKSNLDKVACYSKQAGMSKTDMNMFFKSTGTVLLGVTMEDIMAYRGHIGRVTASRALGF